MKSDYVFNSVCDLANDRGFIGKPLSAIPDSEWLFPEAERWPDPWKFLLELPCLPKPFERLFRAAQSQRRALSRLAEIIRAGGSVEVSWTRKLEAALKSRDGQAIRHLEQKVLASMWRYDRSEQLLAAAKK